MNMPSGTTDGMKETCSLREFWRGFLNWRRDRTLEKRVERIPRVGPHFLAALITRSDLSRSRHFGILTLSFASLAEVFDASSFPDFESRPRTFLPMRPVLFAP